MSGDELPEGMPPFLISMIKNGAEQASKAQMHQEDYFNRVHELAETLKPEQLVTLREILNMESDSAPLNFIDGIIVATLRLHHKVCAGCGKEHTLVPDTAEDLLTPERTREGEGETQD